MSGNAAALARIVFLQQERCCKHDPRDQSKEPVSIEIGERTGLELKDAVEPTTRLITSCLGAQTYVMKLRSESANHVLETAGCCVFREYRLVILSAPGDDGGQD